MGRTPHSSPSRAGEGKTPALDAALYPSTVFGPMCDSLDVLSHGVLLPQMNVGDWMYFQNI